MTVADDPALSALRHRFATDDLATASGPRIVTMCFDRLDRDLAAARSAIERTDHYETNAALAHAQDLLAELVGMLDVTAWEHATALASVYDYLLRLLAAANVAKSAALVAEAQRLVAELGGAFREASAAVPSSIPPVAVTAPAPTHAGIPDLAPAEPSGNPGGFSVRA